MKDIKTANSFILVQLLFLAALVVGSWINLQQQLDLLRRDISMLLQNQKNLIQKIETAIAKTKVKE